MLTEADVDYKGFQNFYSLGTERSFLQGAGCIIKLTKLPQAFVF